MADKTQTIAKAAPKAAPKAVAKAAQAPKVEQTQAPKASTGGANLVAMIVEGIAKRVASGSAYYATALSYHRKAGTVFPRARNNETRAALKVEDVAQVFDMHDKKILASGNAKGQAMFDVYMMQAK